MCSPATCHKCSKTTWSGCGQHVDQVMRHVPDGQRCTCDDREQPRTTSIRRLFGR